MSSIPMAKVQATTPNIAGMADMDIPRPDFENPIVHGADTGGQGSMSALTWRSKSATGHGRVAGLGAWNRGTAVNFNAGSQFRTQPPISGG